MGKEVNLLRELTERVRVIQDNSSDCGEYTDEQLEELSTLAVRLADHVDNAMESLIRECDRLRDGPRSMVEGDYVYYENPEKRMPPRPGVRVQLQMEDGEGKLHFSAFDALVYRMQVNALREGKDYVSLEMVTDKECGFIPHELRELLPDARVVEERLRSGLKGM